MKAKPVTLFSLVRIRHWWYSKIPMYLSFGLILGVGHYSFRENIIYLSFLLAWLTGGAAFGYFLNDSFDIGQDLAAGKPNASSLLSPYQRFFFALALALFSLAPWMILGRPGLIALAFFQISVFMLYSMSPVRLKDRLYAGILADSLYAYLIPSALILSLYSKNHIPELYIRASVLPLMIWALAAGMRAILYHHFIDRKKDASTAMGNVVNKFGAGPNLTALNILIIIELASFCVFYLQEPFLPVKVAVLLIYTAFSFISFSRIGFGIVVFKKIRYGRFAFFNFYEKWLLFIISVLAIHTDWRYIFLLIVFILLFMVRTVIVRPYYIFLTFYYKVIVGIYIAVFLRLYYIIRFRIIVPLFYMLVFNILRPVGSYVVNHSIYFYRRRILRLSDQQARGLTTTIPFTAFLNVKPQATKQYNYTTGSMQRQPKYDLEFTPGPLTADNKIVNGLWIGNTLSKIELLTIRSFIDKGHEFHLWIYEPMKTKLPDGVIIRDANEIIDASKIFRYKYANHFGHGKGSVSGFSDIFRYKLLYDKGGWWTDMDMTCLRPLNVASPYFFRSHHELFLVGNIMKVPKGSELMALCYREASETIDAYNRDWHKPIEILNKYVEQLHLDGYVITGLSNEDKWNEVKLYAKGKTAIPERYMVLHWMNEEWRSRKMDKDDLRLSSTLATIMTGYRLMQTPAGKAQIWKNELRHMLYLPLFEFYQE